MAISSARDFRPLWHYSPSSGWINDPNGLLWDGKLWHLFAQHTPQKRKPGDMYWLHAVSEDLIHWRELGIAIAPDELGVIYSGSAVMDGDQYAAIFTHHGKTEQQSLAFSEDGVNFTPYSGNPVIKNTALRDFRDPKVFRNEALGGWSMVVAAGPALHFYHSSDLLEWEQTGAFGEKENRLGGIFECPDLFPLPAPGGGTLWVLTASMAPAGGGNCMQYFLGAFDGHTFRQTVPTDALLLIDAGPDNYAAVTFFQANCDSRTQPIQIGWANNWAYAARTPTGNWRGCMTLARRLSLVQTGQGIRLAAQPVLPPLGQPKPASGDCPLPGESFVLDIEAPGDFSAAFVNSTGERFAFGCENGVFYTDRTKTGRLLFNTARTPRLLDGPVRMHVVFDRCVTEIFADDGIYANTTLLFPKRPYEALELQGAKAEFLEV